MKLGFTMIPNELFETDTWDQVNKSVLWCLIDLYRMKRNKSGGGFMCEATGNWIEVKKNECFGSLDYFASRWSCNRNTANKYLKTMQKAGFIKLKQNRSGTRVKFNFFDDNGLKIETNSTPNLKTNSRQSVGLYNKNNNYNNNNNTPQVKKTKTGLLMGFCSACGKQEFPIDDWQVKSGSTCCRVKYVAERDEALTNKYKL